MNMQPQPELVVTPDATGYEAVPDSESLLRAIPGLHYEKRLRGTNYPSLYEELDLDAAHAELAAARQAGPEAYDQARVTLARNATKLVSGALWFDPGEKNSTIQWRPLSIGELIADQRTDCYGHTLVLSASLEQLGIEHYIAYTNGHTFVVLPTGSGKTASAWIFDAVPKESHQDLSKPANPALVQDLSGVIEDDGFIGIADQIAARGRGAFTMDPQALVAKFARPNETYEVASQRNPWLGVAGRRYSREENGNPNLTVSVFEATQGREMLARHLAFQRAVGANDFDASAQLALNLAGQFPDLETRNPELLNAIRATTNWLTQRGELARAAQVTEAFFSSLRPFTDGVALQEGKIWAEIAARLAAELGHVALGAQVVSPGEIQPDALLSTVRGAAQRALGRAVALDPSRASEASRIVRYMAGDNE